MLKEKVAVITGSTSGIGLGIAHAFAAQGINLVINGLGDANEIEALRQDLSATYKVQVLYHPADMTKPSMIEDMIATTHKHFGRLDILVNNAGIQHVAPVEEFPVDKWDQIIAINLSSAFHTIRCAIPHMKQSGWGRIINISSIHGMVASPFKTAYNSAKHGIMGLTKTVALEVAQNNITVNAICPGYVRTPLVEKQIAAQAVTRGISEADVINTVMLTPQPTKKFTTVEQIGDFCVFLCSDSASNITGSTLPMDGGWTAT
jgi:3-hydroxybutyrate dehydrogenase